ncbi:aminopeptidase [Ferroacidibacillus organovorans]|uniref:Aminopeptidase n=1 Tax=Ferroacidibacillus organovorans TaxID=1765683 RepID=A0A162UAK0_9BACL|nr:aminopeptidase [Ferroacidibacillus organovorans]KYP81602.1 peptidase M29 [Ferroacidibacillus organovorans]OAG94949.1 peptidase M29 [Ferroacidibacillus organovorans]OPG14973.1 aminopeptidase [Ferroacidibacillus organovorans]
MDDLIRKYAELAVRVGVNVQPGQPLVIGFGLRQVLPEHIAFARQLTEAAYAAGSSYVHVEWGDEAWSRETLKHGSLALLDQRAAWHAQWIEKLAAEQAAFIAISATDPSLYDGIASDRVHQYNSAVANELRAFNQKRTNDEYAWTILAAPTQAWANWVERHLPERERVAALWDDILFCTRATADDPVAEWKAHLHALSARSAWLNELNITKFHYRSAGTDLEIAMPNGYYFTAAQHKTPSGVPFTANIPTEEVYSVPKRTGVNGYVTSTMPLNHQGSLIEGIFLRFVNGRIVEYRASKGQDALAKIVESDEGSHYLGEIALVPKSSPIAKRGRLFYNTLFDENASCHLAIGESYPLIEGGHLLSRSEWAANDLNESVKHVDFMIGSNDLSIDGVDREGRVIPIFRDGTWANELR